MVSVCFTGHRPKQLFGTNDINNPKATLLTNQLTRVIEYLILKQGAVEFVSGGALGTDQIAFICVHNLKKKYPQIKNVLAVPYSDQSKGWEELLAKAKQEKWASKTIADLELTIKRYEKIVAVADEVVLVDTVEGYQPRGMKPEQVGRHSNAKLNIRNIYMVDRSEIVVAVFDGNKGGTYNCVQAAKKRNRKLIVLDPKDDFKAKKDE